MMRTILLLFLCLLLPAVALAPTIPTMSPLTDTRYSWLLPDNATLGLPWYAVTHGDIQFCARGLTTKYGYEPGQNEIVGAQLVTPIYRDTISITAKRQRYQDVTFYQLGWYAQPYEGAMGVKVTLFDSQGTEHVLSLMNASKARASKGYEAFPIPCDADNYRCPPFGGTLERAKIEWWAVVGANEGPHEYLITRFVEVTG